MLVIVDTNVPIVANQNVTPQASPGCVAACAARIRELQSDTIVIDDHWLILNEYKGKLRSSGQPGVGDAFLKWILTNRNNPERCIKIHITPSSNQLDDNEFDEFPTDPDLMGFDRADRKFVAVALAHPDTPPILNATDTDWWIYQEALAKYNIKVQFICPDAMPPTI